MFQIPVPSKNQWVLKCGIISFCSTYQWDFFFHALAICLVIFLIKTLQRETIWFTDKVNILSVRDTLLPCSSFLLFGLLYNIATYSCRQYLACFSYRKVPIKIAHSINEGLIDQYIHKAHGFQCGLTTGFSPEIPSKESIELHLRQ